MSVSAADFGFLAELLRKATANVLGAGKEYLVDARLEPVARAEGLADIAALVARLRVGDILLERKVIEAMMTGETLFFRDAHPFDALEKEILPALIRSRQKERALTIWCAACSYGQEPYSIAMLIHEKFPDLRTWNLKILATDISEASLARARKGEYSKLEVERGLPQEYRRAYFADNGSTLTVQDSVRRLVTFSQLNLIGSWPQLPPCDIVFLRNVLIYFDVAEKRAVLKRVRSVLRRDGCLFLGGGETTFNIDDAFERVQSGRAMYYRQRNT